MQRRACSWRKLPLWQGQMTLGKASAAPCPIRQAWHDTQFWDWYLRAGKDSEGAAGLRLLPEGAGAEKAEAYPTRSDTAPNSNLLPTLD